MDLDENEAKIIIDNRVAFNKYQPNTNRILNEDGDDHYYATFTLIQQLYDYLYRSNGIDQTLTKNDVNDMMNKEIEKQIDSTIDNEMKRKHSIDPATINKFRKLRSDSYFRSRYVKKIAVKFKDANGVTRTKTERGIKLDKVINRYLFDKFTIQAKNKIPKDVKQNIDDEKQNQLYDFEDWLHNNGIKRDVDSLTRNLLAAYEEIELLKYQYEELKNTIAVQKNVRPKYQTVSFGRGHAYNEYNQWLQDTGRTEPEEDLFAKRIEQAKLNQAKQSKPNSNSN